MSDQNQNRQYVRHLVLPSGKRIEVVYFDGVGATELQPGPTTSDLHICGSCDGDLVYPVDWEPVGKSHWRVMLRCPNCEWHGSGVFEQEVVDRFDEQLDRASQMLAEDLRQLMLVNMAEEIERFVAALESDFILPCDF
jgi:hypothetical protein